MNGTGQNKGIIDLLTNIILWITVFYLNIFKQVKLDTATIVCYIYSLQLVILQLVSDLTPSHIISLDDWANHRVHHYAK